MREPANESLFTDVSRLRSYRCTTIVPTTSRAFVEREGCCASELDKGHKRVGKGASSNAEAHEPPAWRRAHASVESANTALTRGHGARNRRRLRGRSEFARLCPPYSVSLSERGE